jgi:hydrophobic/amphiphilic exporter-1 (mainly G- bacteria), HAE1 family
MAETDQTQSTMQRQSDLASLSVRRPVLAAVFSMLILLAGLAAIFGVQVRELPDVDRPVITITTVFESASPETIDTQVTSIIEGAVSRVSDVASISSNSRHGRSRVVVEFNPSVDLNTAASDLREAVGSVRNRIPDDVEEPRIVKADADARPMMQLSVTSVTLGIDELTSLIENRILDRFSAVYGVADVQLFGDREQVMAVTIDAIALAARNLTIDDVQTALRDVAADAPAGSFDADAQTLIVRADASVITPDDLEATYVNRSTQIGDIAHVRLAPDEGPTGRTSLRSNGERGIGIGILRQAQSNTLVISRGVRDVAASINEEFAQLNVEVSSDEAIFVEGAVNQVIKTLLLATAIVVLIIFIFLRNVRATLIPALTVPIAIIGALAGLWIAGFSVNILTLLALVLATGMVVDDSIVVLENIERRRREGMRSRAAAVIGTRQVFFAVVATTAVLVAVFVPISFLPGTAGRLFFEFGFVLAIAVILSSLVALTLAPMLASRLLQAAPAIGRARVGPLTRLSALLGSVGDAVSNVYLRTLDWALKAPLVVLTLVGLFASGAYVIYQQLPEQLLPREDRGMLMMIVRAPQGSSLEYTESKVREVEAIAFDLIDRGDATNVFSIVGRGGGPNAALITVPLTPWEKRSRNQIEISAEVTERLTEVVGARVTILNPNSLSIRGGGQGLQFAVVGSNYDEIAEAAETMVRGIEDQIPGLQNPMLTFDMTQPQVSVNVDRRRATDLGISLESVSLALQTMLDGRQVGYVHDDDHAIPIRMQASEGVILSPGDLEHIFIRANGETLVPLASIVSLEEVPIAPSLNREGQMRAVPIRSTLADGYDMRSAMTEIRTLAAETLPPTMGIRFLSEAATLEDTSRALALTFLFAFLVILLVLAAQFESFLSALIIMITVPFGLAAAVFAMALSGGSLNIYSQVGLVMLVGLMAKNGILIVEFANQLRDRGRNVGDAIREACAVRFRPVMMTLVSTVMGGVPLIVSFGPGAEAREALGWIIVGGLGFSTLFTLYLAPVAFLLLAGFSRPRASEGARLQDELTEAETRALMQSGEPA